MLTSNEKQVVFYQKIGELFYAIAAADKVVREQEYKALKKLVQTEWTSIDDYKDEFNTDAVFQMEIVFEWFEYEQMDADDCFESFKEYFQENRKLFTEKRRQLIWKTANKIAASFSGKNKSELIMLTKLLSVLQEDTV